MFILVLEASTSSAKAMYYDTFNGCFDVVTRPYMADFPCEYTMFRPDRVYERMIEAGREAVRGRAVDAISLCSAWHSVGLFNDRIEPVTPMYQWSNGGGSRESAARRTDGSYVKAYYEMTGCMVNAIYPFFKLLMLKKQYVLPEYRIMGQGTYNNYRLTGRLNVTDCILSGTRLMDIRRLEYAQELLDEIGITVGNLPTLCTYKEKFTLAEEAAGALGIKAGIPVVISCADGALNQTGAGALGGDVMTFSVGTSGALRISTDRPLLSPKQSTWCYRSPAGWLSGAATNGGTNCIEWFRRMAFGADADYSSIEKGAADRLNTPVFLPFVFGERCPGWNDTGTGSFFGLRQGHSLCDMYLAVEEGILFNLYQCYKALIAEHVQPRHIRLSGGILNSRQWTQMCADIFGKRMETDACKHASLMGGAVLAQERLGIIEDVREYTLPPTGVVEPNLEMTDIYREKFSRYLRYYEKLKLRQG